MPEALVGAQFAAAVFTLRSPRGDPATQRAPSAW